MNTLRITVTYIKDKKTGSYNALIEGLDIVGEGETKQKAKENLFEIFDNFLETNKPDIDNPQQHEEYEVEYELLDIKAN